MFKKAWTTDLGLKMPMLGPLGYAANIINVSIKKQYRIGNFFG